MADGEGMGADRPPVHHAVPGVGEGVPDVPDSMMPVGDGPYSMAEVAAHWHRSRDWIKVRLNPAHPDAIGPVYRLGRSVSIPKESLRAYLRRAMVTSEHDLSDEADDED